MSPIRLSKMETAIRLVLDFHKAFNQHDVPGMTQLLSDDCVFEAAHPAPDGTPYSGKPAVTRVWEDFFQDSPQARIEIEEVFGLGDRCILRWKFDSGDGETPHLRGVDVFRVENGLICEQVSYVKAGDA